MKDNRRILTQGVESLRSSSVKVQNQAENFLTRYTKFFQVIEGDLSTNWQGSGSQEFREKANEMRPKYQQMYEIINQYAFFISQTADAYEQQAQDIANEAKALSFE